MSNRSKEVTSSRQELFQALAGKIVLVFAVCLVFQARVIGQPLVVQRVTVSGTERPLRLETKAGELLDRGRVARDVKRLWETGWFDDIRVLNDSIPEGAVLRFVLTERPRYLLRKVRFRPRHFELPAPISPGTFVDMPGVNRVARTFQERLRDSGYRDAVVNFELIPLGIRQADILFRVDEGKRYVVGALKVSGLSPADSSQVARSFGAIQPRTLLPGIPRLWKGWKLRRALDQQTLDLALQDLRSRYISRGHLDATTNVESITFERNRASLSIRVVPGTPYRMEGLQIFDSPTPTALNIVPNQLPSVELCRCLIEKRAQAERNGALDFETRLLVHPGDNTGERHAAQGVSIAAHVKTGPSYRVRNIEFRGNHHLSDVTLRKALLLSEGERFDRSRLLRSLTRLSLTGLIHPLSEFNVEVQRDSSQQTVDLMISVREKDKGRWFFGAPLWTGLASRSWFSISSDLPNWGPSYLELPTHFIAMNFMSPLPGLPLSIFSQARLSVSLARPYLPGQGWRSGFQVSPQASWPQMLLSSSLLQIRPRLEERLQQSPSLRVPVQWSTMRSDEPGMPTVGVLICHPSRKPQARLMSYLSIASEWLFAAGL
jgi:outer membrane protein assembly factor BamA